MNIGLFYKILNINNSMYLKFYVCYSITIIKAIINMSCIVIVFLIYSNILLCVVSKSRIILNIHNPSLHFRNRSIFYYYYY